LEDQRTLDEYLPPQLVGRLHAPNTADPATSSTVGTGTGCDTPAMW
jgi:hypothetical protein